MAIIYSSAYLLLGSNLGNREDILVAAIKEIGVSVGIVQKESSIYESEPWGFESENGFLNQVIKISTELKPNELLDATQNIEKKLGRIRKQTQNYSSRTIDIDILYYNNEVIDMPHLSVPHQLIHKRMFTLLPLVEIASDLFDPLRKKKVSQLLSECDDTSMVKKYEANH